MAKVPATVTTASMASVAPVTAAMTIRDLRRKRAAEAMKNCTTRDGD
ncbi:MAG: hypothetical protein Q8M26_04400 [Pseudolabrys sp.]|nr:hypothetical protein [Pseudolabrys sp.]